MHFIAYNVCAQYNGWKENYVEKIFNVSSFIVLSNSFLVFTFYTDLYSRRRFGTSTCINCNINPIQDNEKKMKENERKQIY